MTDSLLCSAALVNAVTPHGVVTPGLETTSLISIAPKHLHFYFLVLWDLAMSVLMAAMSLEKVMGTALGDICSVLSALHSLS